MKAQLTSFNTSNSDQQRVYYIKRKAQKKSKIQVALKKLFDLITR